MEKLTYDLVVVGLGAVYHEHLSEPLSVWTDPMKNILVDIEASRFLNIDSGRKIIADINNPPFNSGRLLENTVAVIATPDHLPPIKSLSKVGFQKFMVEKPLVKNLNEVDELKGMLKNEPTLRIYALEMIITKLTPLYLLTGMIPPDDPRWQWVEDQDRQTPTEDLYNGLEKQIGEVQGIEMTVLEGGSYGVLDLKDRSWLENDPETGGMLLDLGTHALGPLVAAGLIDSADDIRVDIAKRYVLGQDRRSFIEADPGQPEIYADTLMGISYQGRDIPLSMKLAKTYHDGGVWKLVIRGSRGDISAGLIPGQKLTIEPNEGRNISLRLKNEEGIYGYSFAEADLYFKDSINFDGNQRALLDSVTIIDRIKQAS